MPLSPILVIVRRATESDIPAILLLLLTSFRQFPLFSRLYAPLADNLSNADDTLFFWRRRLLAELLDPSATVLIAEIDPDGEVLQMAAREGATGADAASWEMLDFLSRHRKDLYQIDRVNGRMAVGFAVCKSENIEANLPMDWMSWLRSQYPYLPISEEVDFALGTIVALELRFWGKVYRRKDQDRAAYKSYLRAEHELTEMYHNEALYYIDNLCTDFRYGRLGIGTLLLEMCLLRAKEAGLPVITEASPMGLGLYKKAGFKQIGVWRIHISDEEGNMELPVLRLSNH